MSKLLSIALVLIAGAAFSGGLSAAEQQQPGHQASAPAKHKKHKKHHKHHHHKGGQPAH